MNPEDQFGEVVWQDKNFVMRAQVDQMDSLHVVVHRKVDGREVIPVGYIPGITTLDVHA